MRQLHREEKSAVPKEFINEIEKTMELRRI